MSSYIELTYWDVAIAALLMIVNAALSIRFQLKAERTLLISTVRMCIQLLAIGFVLKFIFGQSSPWWTIGLATLMVTMAGREVLARQSVRFRGFEGYLLNGVPLTFVCMCWTLFGVGALIGPDPWYAPRFFLPVLGMMLGNTLTGISLGLETLTTSAQRERNGIEARIALGASRDEAFRSVSRHALKTGTMPIVNSMAASGIVTLPGMMTGQILSGVDPVEAVKYQLLIMFLIASATALGTFLAVMGGARLLSDDRHRLRLDRLECGSG